MNLTKDELAAEIKNPNVKAVIDGITLPAGMIIEEFAAHIMDAGRKAAIKKNAAGTRPNGNTGLLAGDEDFIAAWREPAAVDIPGTAEVAESRTEVTYGLRVQLAKTLDGLALPNQ